MKKYNGTICKYYFFQKVNTTCTYTLFLSRHCKSGKIGKKLLTEKANTI